MKTQMPRRAIEELITIYEYETSLRDIYVEGNFDKCLLEWYFENTKITGISIYEISDIDIPDQELKVEYEKNNRDRILYLIERLNEKRVLCKYKGLVDKDILKYTRGLPEIENLSMTDYCCMEMYAFCKEVFGKINKLCLGGKIQKLDEFMDFISKTAVKLSALAIYEKREKIGLSKTDFEKYICVDKGSLKFKFNIYLKAVLDKNGIGGKYEEVTMELKKVESELIADDPREWINGHQMVRIIKELLKKWHIIGNQSNDESVRGMILAALEISQIAKYNLFFKIIEFAKDKCA